MFKITYHRDGTISFWNVFEQAWQRRNPARISDEVMASFSYEERNKIDRFVKRMQA